MNRTIRPNSVGQWIAIYKQNGFDELCKISYHRNQSFLDKNSASIIELFTSQPPSSIDEARLKIKELTGIEQSNTRVRAFMKRHKFHFLKTGHIPALLFINSHHNTFCERLKWFASGTIWQTFSFDKPVIALI